MNARSDLVWLVNGATGVSSHQLIAYCAGILGTLRYSDRPRDEGDFLRCARAVRMAPAGRAEKARAVLRQYFDWYEETRR